MKIEVKHRFTGAVIVEGEYQSLKECLEKNRGANLRGADLRDADLRDADLRGAYLRDAYLRDADLRGADLRDAYLRDADLGGADLRGAYLRDAYLGGALHYRDSHDLFQEIVRRQKVSVFTDTEWSAIGQITIHRLCWDSIQKRFGNVMGHIFEIMAKAGFDEWLKHWQEIQHEKN